MKEIEIISESKNYTVGDLGSFEKLSEYSYMFPHLGFEIPGKVFIGKKIKTTGAEVSFQIMPPNTDIPFYHKHNKNEEIYVFLKGKGQFQIDDDIFDVKEGTIIRISPEGKRTWKNNSNKPLILMVIQSKQGSIENFETSDGVGVNEQVKWNKDS